MNKSTAINIDWEFSPYAAMVGISNRNDEALVRLTEQTERLGLDVCTCDSKLCVDCGGGTLDELKLRPMNDRQWGAWAESIGLPGDNLQSRFWLTYYRLKRLCTQVLRRR